MDRLPAQAVLVRRRAAVRGGVTLGAIGAAVGAVLAAEGDVLAAGVLASTVAGLLAVLGGGANLTLGRDPGGLPRFRLAAGALGLLYGAGMLVNAVERARGSSATLTSGDLVALGAMPFALVLLAAAPRPAVPAGRPSRLLADAGVVAAAAAMMAWQTFLTVPEAALGPLSWGSLAALLVQLFSLGYLVGLAVLGHDRHVVLLLLGVMGVVAGNLLRLSEWASGGGGALWLPLAVVCVGAPLLLGGPLLMRSQPSLTGGTSGAAESRTSLSTFLILLTAGAAVFIASLGGSFDLVDRSLLGLMVISVLVRDVVVQRQRMRDLETLRHLAEHDALTGAGNRRALTRVLGEPSEEPRTVIVLDLDGFKGVNDRYGPGVGDTLLRAVARELSTLDPESGQVFRLGADDFAVLAPGDRSRGEDLARRACALVTQVSSRVPGAERLSLNAHAGVDCSEAGAPVVGGDAWLPVTRATQALVAAQRDGRARIVVWGEELTLAQQRRSLLEERLRASLAERSLEIHLQPVVALATGRLQGFEALSRWHDEVLGPVFPDEFVPVAEETGLVADLGASVLDAALAALVRCQGVARALTMAVNASPVELRCAGYVEHVAAALAEHGVPPDLLVVEVTEAVMVSPDDPAVVSLHALADMGVRVAVDDFGTGYSSLAYLTRLPVHVLKIDRSLTMSLDERAPSAVVQAAAAMAAGMSLEVIAEGVEDLSQLVALAAMGIASGQGWLWSRAVPEQEAVDLVLAGRALGPTSEDAAAGLAPAAGGEVTGP